MNETVQSWPELPGEGLFRSFAILNCTTCFLTVLCNGFALKWLCKLWKTGDSFRTTNSVFLCLTLVDLTRGLTDSPFYFLLIYTDNTRLEAWCPVFAMFEVLPAISLSTALFLAVLKSLIFMDTFRVKRYLTPFTSTVTMALIVATKVGYTAYRVAYYGVALHSFSGECFIMDHYHPTQIYTSFVINYELVLCLLILFTGFMVYKICRSSGSTALPYNGQRLAMLRCAACIMGNCIGCYSVFVGWRSLLIHNVTLPPLLFANIKLVKLCAEHLLLNLNSMANPCIYILNNRSIRAKLRRHRGATGRAVGEQHYAAGRALGRHGGEGMAAACPIESNGLVMSGVDVRGVTGGTEYTPTSAGRELSKCLETKMVSGSI